MIGEKHVFIGSQLWDMWLFIQRGQLTLVAGRAFFEEKSSLQNAGFETFYLRRRDSEHRKPWVMGRRRGQA